MRSCMSACTKRPTTEGSSPLSTYLSPSCNQTTTNARSGMDGSPDASGDRDSAPGVAGLSAEYSHPDRNLRETQSFMSGLQDEEAEFDRVLATVLFTDIVDSTASAAALGDRAWRDLVERHHAIIRGALARFAASRSTPQVTASSRPSTVPGAPCDVRCIYPMPSVRSASRSGQAYTQESARPSTGRSAASAS